MERILFSLIWGQLSTQFFFRSWMSFLGILCCVMSFFRVKLPVKDLFSLLFSKVTETIFFSMLLVVGFYFFYNRLSWGKTEMEVFVFFISATVRLVFVLFQIPKAIDDAWNAANLSEKKSTDF